ncbi:hypothetical protein [Frankia sp. CiP1_Cm_nod1]|uniref:hypothetical protein n=1 Tax=Frankia sp. CiP1_Cm_nod1 TaxID=2897160 RepID=UPI002024F28C
MSSVFAEPSEPRFEFVDVQPRAGVVGEAVVVRWSALNADEVYIEGNGVFPPKGSHPVELRATCSLRLMARGRTGGVVEAQTPVMRAFSPPVISFLEIPAPPSGTLTGIVSPAALFELRDELVEVRARAPRGLPSPPGIHQPGMWAGGGGWLAGLPSSAFSAGRLATTTPAGSWGRAVPLFGRAGHRWFPSPPAGRVRFRKSGGHGPDRGREGVWGRMAARLWGRERLS